MSRFAFDLARRLRRRPIAYWSVTAVLALTTAAVVTGVVGRAEARLDRYGTLAPAVVARTDRAAGSALAPDDVEVQRLPAALLPPGALRTPPSGAVLADAVHEGEVVLAARLAPAGVSPLVARLPAATVALAVPTGPAALPLEVGDVVDVLATFDPGLAGEDGAGEAPTVVVARGALVVDVGPEAVAVAVKTERAPRVAFAVSAGAVVLAAVSAAPSASVTAGRSPPGG
ncbi:hypothetical protein BH18ACT1_BH18ACT1_07530 [soil metagenome]